MPTVKLIMAEKTTLSSIPIALRSWPAMTAKTASQKVCRRPNTFPASKDFLQWPDHMSCMTGTHALLCDADHKMMLTAGPQTNTCRALQQLACDSEQMH